MGEESTNKNRGLVAFMVVVAILLFCILVACIVFAIVIARLASSLQDLRDVVAVHHQQLIVLNEEAGW